MKPLLHRIPQEWRSTIIGVPAIGLFSTIGFSGQAGISDLSILLKYFLGSTIFTGLIWVGCMTIVRYLWKRYPWHINPKPHLLIEIVVLTVYVIAVTFISSLFFETFHMDVTHEEFQQSVLVVLLIAYLVTSIHEGVMFYGQWQKHFKRSEQFQRSKIQAQFETLKTQINPHFLFNSLNTLMVYVEDNPRASEFVSSLSDFMRYVLNNRDKDLVLLRDELRMVKQYSYIQQSRFGAGLNVHFNVDEKYYHYSIVPLSLQMLLENTVKHNVISTSKPLTVTIKITEGPSLIVENNIQPKQDVDSTGVGLKNIRDRYAILTSRPVHIFEDTKVFRVGLPLLEAEL